MDGVCEIVSLFATGILGIISVVRGHPRAALVPFIAAASFAGTLLVFVFGNALVNAMVPKATAATCRRMERRAAT